MTRWFSAAVLAGAMLAVCGWFAWSPYEFSSQEGIANYAKADDWFRHFPGWWSGSFQGGTSLAPLWGTLLSSLWLWVCVQVFGLAVGIKISMLACVPLAAGTMFLFARRLVGREDVAFCTAVFYALLPSLWMRIFFVEHVVVVCALALLPLMCWSIVGFVREPKTRTALVAAMYCSLLALVYVKTALLAAPVLAVFALGLFWNERHLFHSNVKRVLSSLAVLGVSLFLLGVLPNLPALREARFVAMFEFGPLVGWQHTFCSKSALQFFDRLGGITASCQPSFAASTGLGGQYLGALVLIALAGGLIWRKRIFSTPRLEKAFRAMLALGLFSFWLSFGPYNVLMGTLAAVRASVGASDVLPALLWLSLLLQGWVVWRVFRYDKPTTVFESQRAEGSPITSNAIPLLAIVVYFLVPGFRILNMLPLYRDIRAPFDFYQIAGMIWFCVAAGIVLALVFAKLRVGWRRPVLAACALIAGWDFAGHLALPQKTALAAGTFDDFHKAAEFLKKSPEAGAVWAFSGRYFYLLLPSLTERPLVQEAFQSYLQQRGYAAMLAIAQRSSADFFEFMRIAGVRYIFLDIHDVDKQFADKLRERLPSAFKNDHFEVLKYAEAFPFGFAAQDTLGMDTPALPNIAASFEASGRNFAAISPRPSNAIGDVREGGIFLEKNAPASGGKFWSVPAYEIILENYARGRFVFETLWPLDIMAQPQVRMAYGPFILPLAWHPDWHIYHKEKASGKASCAFGSLVAVPSQHDSRIIVPIWYNVAIIISIFSWLFVVIALIAQRRKGVSWKLALKAQI